MSPRSDALATASGTRIFAGPGEMRALCRALDWSATPLGPVETWSHSLRTTVATLLASRHPMFLFWGPDLVQFYNDAYRPSLADGGRHPRALGMRGAEFWTEIWDIIGPQITQVMTGGPATWHEDALVPIERNGRIEEVYWTYSYSPVLDDDERVGGTLVVCQETTARVLTERRLRALTDELSHERSRLQRLLDAAPAVMAVYAGPEHVITYLNPRWERVVGKPAALGKSFRDVFPEFAGTDLFEHMEQAFRTLEPYAASEMRLPIPRGAEGPIEESHWDVVLHPFIEEGERAILMHAVDVTTQVSARREIEAARAQAEEANRAKSEFLAVMSHELRTPLNAIAGYADLLEMEVHGPITPRQRQSLLRIKQSQGHLLGLINGVLEYARVEKGMTSYRVETVALDALFTECEGSISPQARAKGVALTVDGTSGLAVNADREKTRQVVLNLLSNAIKFTDGAGRVDLTAEAVGERVAVHMRDTGRGIAPDQLERIFEPFVQLDNRLTREQEGTGLGLAISRDLARGMGGDITVASELGVGSTFTLSLPRTSPT